MQEDRCTHTHTWRKAMIQLQSFRRYFFRVDNSPHLVESQVPSGKRVSKTGQEVSLFLLLLWSIT